MTEPRLKILAPWAICIKKIEALFGGDPQIHCYTDYSGDDPYIILACTNGDKVRALQLILPEEFEFGNVTLKVDIDGAPSDIAFTSKKQLFETAFSGNPAFARAFAPAEEGYEWFAMTYVVFKNCVVQFFADNINDCHGVISCLYQDLADDILTGTAVENVYFNTDIERGSIGVPTGEWP